METKHSRNTNNRERELTKRTQSVSNAPEITPVLPIAGQKYLPYFEGYLEFFRVFQNFYLKITRSVTQPLMKSRRSVAGQHWSSHCHKAPHDNWISGLILIFAVATMTANSLVCNVRGPSSGCS
jgi:hypothetical protein